MHDGTFRSYFGAIGVPVLDKGDGTISLVTHDWANAMAQLGGGLAVTVMRLEIRNRRVDLAKEKIAEEAIKNHAQWVYFADDDVVPPPDALLKMLRRWKSDPKYKIISGVYFSKSDPPMPLIFKGNLEGSFWDWTKQDIITADGAGAGALFVDTEVFKKMSKPWFSCNYFFEDPRSEYDIRTWQLSDELANELSKGKDSDPKIIHDLEEQIKAIGEKTKQALEGKFDPALLEDKGADGSTTEDLYFFKKAKEELGLDLFVDCSIQCWHQDKTTGRMFGLTDDMPQSKPRYEGKVAKRGTKIVLDIGSADSPYYIPDGVPVRVDINPITKPDIVADARQLPLKNCFADVVFSSHLLEHFSYHEVVPVLKEWVRVLKIGGKLVLVIPNLRWAAKHLLSPESKDPEEMKRVLFMFHSSQPGTLLEAYTDYHKSGFVPESLFEILKGIKELSNIEIYTSDGNYGDWKDKIRNDGFGYNIIAVADKIKHNSSISLKAPLKVQEEAMYHIGEKAIPTTLGVTTRDKKKVIKVSHKKRGRPRKTTKHGN